MPTVIEGIKLYTIPETAELLKVHIVTVRNYIKSGNLRSQRIGRPIYISELHLREFIKGAK